MIAAPLSAPATFAGTMDATHECCHATPRTLEQCAGMQRSSTARIDPIGAQAPMRIADKAVLIASSLAGLFVVALLTYERFAS